MCWALTCSTRPVAEGSRARQNAALLVHRHAMPLTQLTHTLPAPFQFVGYSQDSRLPADFDVTELLRPGGENVLAVQARGSRVCCHSNWTVMPAEQQCSRAAMAPPRCPTARVPAPAGVPLLLRSGIGPCYTDMGAHPHLAGAQVERRLVPRRPGHVVAVWHSQVGSNSVWMHGARSGLNTQPPPSTHAQGVFFLSFLHGARCKAGGRQLAAHCCVAGATAGAGIACPGSLGTASPTSLPTCSLRRLLCGDVCLPPKTRRHIANVCS